MLLRKPTAGGYGETSSLLGRRGIFLAFKRKDWDHALTATSYRADAIRGDQLCVLTDGGVCWRLSPDRVLSAIQFRTLVLFVFALALTGLCAWVAIRKFREQKLEEERKRFALQTLTHELRTPLTSLVVSSEEVLDRFDDLPVDLQGTLVRMCDDIQRLHRLAEVSKTYLNSDGGGLIRLRIQEVLSIHSYLRSILEPFEGHVEETFPSNDGAFSMDSHWVGVCIKNLIENALQHGVPPVRFSADIRDGILEVWVADAGTSLVCDLDEMTEPFKKGSSSRGLGLGLSIVKKVAEAMKADLSYVANPTRFCLRIYQGRDLR